MTINQLFQKEPDKHILDELLRIFGYVDSNNLDKPFTKDDLVQLKVVEKMGKLRSKLKEYYLPCKAKLYCNTMSPKSCITILRQFLKVHDLKLNYWEGYTLGTKKTFYKIESNKVASTSQNYTPKTSNFIVSFN